MSIYTLIPLLPLGAALALTLFGRRLEGKGHRIVIPAGAHVARWEYQKDFLFIAGDDAGWVDEVRDLLQRGYRRELPSMQALGYRWVRSTPKKSR